MERKHTSIVKVFENPKNNTYDECVCKFCKLQYWEKKYKRKTHIEAFCSNECRKRGKNNLGLREKNPFWKGGRIYRHGYISIKVDKNYPGANKQGYIPEHRYLMQKAIGRNLTYLEDVHHINGIKDDNRLENLVVILKSEHARFHHPVGHKKSPETRKKMSIAQTGAYWKLKGYKKKKP